MSLPPSHVSKAPLRQALLDRRLSLSEIDRTRMDAAIASHLEHRFSTQPVATLGVFWPIRNEPDLIDLYRRLDARGVNLSLPVVTDKNAPLRFAAWTPGAPMKKDVFRVPVPEKREFVAMPEAILVPCVGFNSKRFRIGYGGGFYDRTLSVTPRPVAIGIAYSCQLVEFEPGPHDVALDVIATEISS